MLFIEVFEPASYVNLRPAVYFLHFVLVFIAVTYEIVKKGVWSCYFDSRIFVSCVDASYTEVLSASLSDWEYRAKEQDLLSGEVIPLMIPVMQALYDFECNIEYINYYQDELN